MDPVKLQTPAAPAQAAAQIPPAAGQPAPVTAAAASGAPASVPTPQLIAAMLKASDRISDLIFSPGRAPQVEISGQLVQLKIAGVGILMPEDTARIAADLIGRN